MLKLVTIRAAVAFATLTFFAGDAMAQKGPARLLFAQKAGEECNIRYWTQDAAEAVILARVDECPDRLFIDQSRQVIFLVDEGEIRSIRIYPVGEISRAPLPERNYKNWLDQMTLRPDANTEYLPSIETLRTVGVRYLDDGSLAVLMSLWMPADDEYHYLFRYADKSWSIIASQWCERWGCEQPTDRSALLHPQNYLSTLDNQTWPESRMVWHASMMQNSYVTSRKEEKIKTSSGGYPAVRVELGLMVDGTSSTLTALASASEHSDTLHTLGVDLLLGPDQSKNLAKNQCLTSIVGRYILVYEFFGGRFELTDLGTGETVLSNLSTAAWID